MEQLENLILSVCSLVLVFFCEVKTYSMLVCSMHGIYFMFSKAVRPPLLSQVCALAFRQWHCILPCCVHSLLIFAYFVVKEVHPDCPCQMFS